MWIHSEVSSLRKVVVISEYVVKDPRGCGYLSLHGQGSK
jgi:hypothetical protein